MPANPYTNPQTGTITFPEGYPNAYIPIYLNAIRANQENAYNSALAQLKVNAQYPTIAQAFGEGIGQLGTTFGKGALADYWLSQSQARTQANQLEQIRAQRTAQLGYAQALAQFEQQQQADEFRRQGQAVSALNPYLTQTGQMDIQPAVNEIVGMSGRGMPGTPPVAQPGPYETMGSDIGVGPTAPEAAPTVAPEPTAIQGVSPATEPSVVQTETPRSIYDAIMLMAASQPEQASRILKLMGPQGQREMFDPLARSIAEQTARQKAASALSLETASQTRMAKLPYEIDRLQAQNKLTEEQAARIPLLNQAATLDAALNAWKVKSLEQLSEGGPVTPAMIAQFPALAPKEQLRGTLLARTTAIKEQHPDWTPGQVFQQAIAETEAQQIRVAGEMGGARVAAENLVKYGQAGAPPEPAEKKSFLDNETVYESLGKLSEQLPRVRLSRITGYLAPILNRVAETGRLGDWIPVPESLKPQLTSDELEFLSRARKYADQVLRTQSGQQTSEQEYRRIMLGFTPSDMVDAKTFLARMNAAGDIAQTNVERFQKGMRLFNPNFNLPDSDLLAIGARNWLRQHDKVYSPEAVKQLLRNPANVQEIRDFMKGQ